MRRHDFVFLDAQGTLLQAKPSLAGIYSHVCSRFGRQVTEKEIVSAVAGIWTEFRESFDPEEAVLDTSDELTRQWWAGFNGRLFDCLEMTGDRKPFLDALWDVFGRAENWELYPEARDVLVELQKRGYRLGVVSNWDSRLIEICNQLDLSSMVDFVVASAAVGMEKPDKRIFEIALAMARVTPDRAVHVGDDYTADVIGARRAGLEAVLLDRDGRHPENGHVPTIRTLSELLDTLA